MVTSHPVPHFALCLCHESARSIVTGATPLSSNFSLLAFPQELR